MHLPRLALVLSLATLLSAPSADAATKSRKAKTTKTVKTAKSAKKKRGAKKAPAPVVPDAFESPEGVTPAEPLDDPEAAAAAKTPSAPVAPATKPGTPAHAGTPAKPATAPAVVAEPVKTVAPPAVTPSQVALFAVPRQAVASDAAVQLEAELVRRLSARDIPFVDLAAAFPAATALPTPKADALFDEGRSAYDNLDPEAAAVKFKAAAEAYTQQPADLRPERLGETYLLLGASLLLNGDTAGAKEAFTRALVAEPTLRPDSALFGQDVQTAFGEAQAALAKQAPGTLVVQSLPEGAKVFVRGREVGTTPLKGVTMPPGQYPVVVQLPGYTSFAAYTEVKPSAQADVKVKFEPSPGLSALRDAAAKATTEKAFDEDVAPPEVGALGERLNARYVVLAAVTKDKKGRGHAEVQAWDLRTKNRLRGVEVELAARDGKRSVAAAADQVSTFLAGPVVPLDGSTPSVSTNPVWRKPWFWAAVGGAAAVTAGVVYVATQPKGSGFNPISGLPGGVTF